MATEAYALLLHLSAGRAFLATYHTDVFLHIVRPLANAVIAKHLRLTHLDSSLCSERQSIKIKKEVKHNLSRMAFGEGSMNPYLLGNCEIWVQCLLMPIHHLSYQKMLSVCKYRDVYKSLELI